MNHQPGLEKLTPSIHEEHEMENTGKNLTKSPTLDTLHNDEALGVIANYHGQDEWTKDAEAKLKRKIDRKILPILCLTYALQYYDKAMLGQAAIFGLRTDLKLESGYPINRYSFAAAIFYLGFICGAYPVTMLAQRFPIHRVAAATIFVWGACLMSTAACKTYQGLWAQRFFLGFLESGISPMFMLVVGSWVQWIRHHYSCTGFISMFSPLINYGIGHITSGSLHPWKYMYLLAGGITLLWAIPVYLLLPGDPIHASGLNERERFIAVSRLKQNNSGVRNTHYKVSQVKEALTDARFLIVFAMAFCITVVNGPVSSFVPIIISQFNFSSLNSLLLTMPGGFVGGALELFGPLLACNVPQIRTYLIVIMQVGTLTGSFLLLFLPLSARAGLLVGVYLLSCFGGSYAVLMGLSLANVAGYTKRSFVSSGLFIGYCLGNFVGPLVFTQDSAPRYRPGFIVTVVTGVMAALLAFAYRYISLRDNKIRDANGVLEGFDHAYEDDLTDKTNPQFRYIV